MARVVVVEFYVGGHNDGKTDICITVGVRDETEGNTCLSTSRAWLRYTGCSSCALRHLKHQHSWAEIYVRSWDGTPVELA